MENPNGNLGIILLNISKIEQVIYTGHQQQKYINLMLTIWQPMSVTVHYGTK